MILRFWKRYKERKELEKFKHDLAYQKYIKHKKSDLYHDGIVKDGNRTRVTLSMATLAKAGPGKAEKMLQAAMKGKLKGV